MTHGKLSLLSGTIVISRYWNYVPFYIDIYFVHFFLQLNLTFKYMIPHIVIYFTNKICLAISDTYYHLNAYQNDQDQKFFAV